MTCQIHERPTAAQFRLLPPRTPERRIPAGELGSGINRFAEPSFPKQTQRGLVLAVITHHEGGAEIDLRFLTRFQHTLRFGDVQAERLFAEHVLAGRGGPARLLEVRVVRRGDIDGVNVQREKFGEACGRARAELLRDVGVRLQVAAPDGGQFSVGRRQDSFGNRAPPRDAARADDTPANFSRHRSLPFD